MVSLLFDFFKISFEFHFQNSNILPVNSLHCYEGASSSLFGKEVFNEKDCGSGAACTKFYGGKYVYIFKKRDFTHKVVLFYIHHLSLI